jgi:excisionase family DNA binding protein
MTIEEVAKTMRVGQKTVYRWIGAGQLPAAKVGYKTFRVFESDLIKFLRSHMTGKNRK